MKIKQTFKLVVLSLTYLISSCSSIDDNNNGSSDPIINRKSIESIFPTSDGFGNLFILRENDKVVKFYSNNTTYYHHVKYDSNSIIEGMNIDGTLNPSTPFTGFNYDYLSGSNTPLDVQFNYTNDTLVSITGIADIAGDIITYNANGSVNSIEGRFILTTFVYENNDENPKAYIIRDLTNPSVAVRWELTFDDKVNPFYKDWAESSFPYPLLELGSLTRESYCFFKNNIIQKDNLSTNETVVISYGYDSDNHPTFYRIERPGSTTRSGTINYN